MLKNDFGVCPENCKKCGFCKKTYHGIHFQKGIKKIFPMGSKH